MKGVFIEHCLEHFSLPAAFAVLKECWRVLAPGGLLRIIVPDAELYVELYYRQRRGDEERVVPFQESESFNDMFSPIMSVNRVFYQDRDSPSGHRSCTTFSSSNSY